ncbi:MAG: hypothetical protein AAFY71_13575 [Bacteroidota bacterium]
MKTNPPLYGRFPFPGIEEYVRRMKLMADTFFSPYHFNSYLITYGKGSFYGLDYKELEEKFEHHKEGLRTISSSCSDSQQRSVNINIRFNKNSQEGEGQFVIVAAFEFERKQIRDMIAGEWTPPTEEELVLFEAEKARAEVDEVEPEPEEEELLEEVEPIQEEIPLGDAMVPGAGKKMVNITDSFHFDESLSFESLKYILQSLSAEYLNRGDFSIRMITTDGELYYNIGYSGLEKIFQKRRQLLLKLLLDGMSSTGEKIQLSLSFGPSARFYNAEIEIFSSKANEIRRKIREFLEESVEVSGPGAKMVHEMFVFDEPTFDLSKVIDICQSVSDRYLEGEKITAFLSTVSGATFPSLNMDQLAQKYEEHHNDQNFLLFSANQSLSGYTFSLMFQFRSRSYEPYGSLSMMWGNNKLHQEIKGDIWKNLALEMYKGPRKKLPTEEENEKGLLISPIFGNAPFETQTGSAVVFMPLEAYWSESIWMHIQDTLSSLGFSADRTSSLYSENRLNYIWEVINKAEIVIADLTYKHPDVFYKIGIAHTLGKPILLLTQHGRDLPSDFKGFAHVVYDNNIYGLQRLTERIIEWTKLQ